MRASGSMVQPVQWKARSTARGTLKGAGIFLLFFLLVLPTLGWMEFSSGSENLVVQTVLEMRRGGQWLVPTLLGEPRVAKPPITVWLTAAAVSPATVQQARSADAAAREQAFADLTWQMRWASWLAACVALTMVYALGTTLRDEQTGVLAALACGTMLLFLRFGRGATTDVQLFVWTCVANVMLATAMVRGRWWIGCAGAGVALGLGIMSKGPVALVQTVLPAAVYLLWRRWELKQPGGARAWPIVVGILLMLAVALPWPAAVLWKYPGVWKLWMVEITREGARDLPADKWYSYAALIPYLLPWIIWFVVGVIAIWRQRRSEAGARLMLPVFLLVVPIVVMSFFRDKPERYLLPMAPAAALIIARGLVEQAKGRGDRGIGWAEAGHWVLLGVMAMGVPVLCLREPAAGGGPSLPLPMAVGTIAAGTVLVLGGVIWSRRRREALVVATVALMFVLGGVFFWSYRSTDSGQNPMRPVAEVILDRFPSAEVWVLDEGVKWRRDLSIYAGSVVKGAADAESIPTDGQQVLVVGVRGSKVPQVPGWEYVAGLTKRVGAKERWHVLSREGR